MTREGEEKGKNLIAGALLSYKLKVEKEIGRGKGKIKLLKFLLACTSDAGSSGDFLFEPRLSLSPRRGGRASHTYRAVQQKEKKETDKDAQQFLFFFL